MNPYADYKVYGPYIHAGQGRYYVYLVNPKHRTSTSYARYLMSIHLGRLLTREEEVDHIDNNKQNDSIDNLQIVTKQYNRAKNRKPTLVKLVCPNCLIEFIRPRNQTHLVKGGKIPTCCSRSCSSKYQHVFNRKYKTKSCSFM